MRLFYCCLLFLLVNSSYAQVRQLAVEPNHSTVGFRLSISGFTEITGKFTDFSIDMDVNEEDFQKSTFDASIKAESINTGIPERDQHLRSADFFDVENYPNITFTSDSIRQVNYSNFTVFGQFTMHGITKAIELPLTLIKKDGNVYGFKIRSIINRLDYKVGEGFSHTSMEDFLAKDVQVEIDFWTKKRKTE